MPPPTLQVTLDPDVQAELERRYHTTRDATTRTRYQIVLLNAQGHTPPQIAQLVRSSADTVRRLLADYLAGVTGYRAGIESVRVALLRAGFVCKRPRWVLSRKAQAQPGWAKNGSSAASVGELGARLSVPTCCRFAP